MEKIKGELNSVFQWIAVLGIIRNFFALFTDVAKLLTPETYEFNGQTIFFSSHLAVSINIVISLLIIAALILTLCKRRLGIYLFTGTCIASVVIPTVLSDDALGTLVIYTCRLLFMFALYFGLLMVKKNGVRSWRLFFPKRQMTNDINDSKQNIIPTEAEELTASSVEIKKAEVFDTKNEEQVNDNEIIAEHNFNPTDSKSGHRGG